MTGRRALDGAFVDAALEAGRGIVSAAQPSRDGLTWQADIIVGIDEDSPVIGHGDVGVTLYDGTAGIAVGLAACATAALNSEAALFAEAARGAARHALRGGDDLLDAGRLGLYEGATGVALGVATAGRALCDPDLLERAATLAETVMARAQASLADFPGSAGLDLIGGLAGTQLGLQSVMLVLGADQPLALLSAGATRLAGSAVPQTWGAAWPVEVDSAAATPPLLGLGHGAAGIALALGEAAAGSADARALRACADGLEYERGWFDAEDVSWPDLRSLDAAGEPLGSMAAWCHGAIGIGLSRLRLTALTGEAVALAEVSAALQAARNLVVDAGTALRSGRPSDCTACHGLAGVAELMLVASRALGVPDHAQAARRVVGLMVEQRDVGGAWPCGLPGAGEIPGLMVGTAGIALTLLRTAGSVDIPSPLLPGPSGW